MERRAFLALVTVQVLFGAWPIAAKLAFGHMDPLALAAARTLGAAAVLLVLHPLYGRMLEATPAIWGLSLLGVVLNQGLFIIGLSMTSAVHAILLVTTIPIFTYALALLLGRETVGPRRATGIGLAFLGAVILIGVGRFEGGMRQVIGDLLVVCNCISFAAFLVLSKSYNERHGAYQTTAAVFFTGALLFLPVAIATRTFDQVFALPSFGWGLLVFIVLGPTVLVYVLNATALRRVPSSTVAVFIYLQPIVTALLAWLVLESPPSWRVLPSAALVFGGLYLVSRRSRIRF